MDRETDLLSPPGLFVGWLTAAWSLPVSVVLSAVGQGLGAVLGGCVWIGVSLPVDRPVWALVNQPVLSFAASTAASGYWLGSLVLPAMVAALALGFVPRPRTWSAEVAAVQVVWASAIVPLAWIPALDLEEGHLARWLHFREVPEVLVALAPAAAATLVVPATLRMLAIERSARPTLGRGFRLLTVFLHLCLPTGIWAAGSMAVSGRMQVVPVVSVTLPMLVALVVAWVGYPAALTRKLDPVGLGAAVRGCCMLVFAVSLLWFAGRPLSGGRCSGILWRTPTSMNNIRSWIDPVPIANLVPAAHPVSP